MQLLINILPSCITLVLYIYIYTYDVRKLKHNKKNCNVIKHKENARELNDIRASNSRFKVNATGCVIGDVFEMVVTEQVEGVEAWVGGQLNSSGHFISVDVMPQWTLERRVFTNDIF